MTNLLSTAPGESRPTKGLAGTLLAVGVLWALVAAYSFLALGAMNALKGPLLFVLVMFLGGPALLVRGSVLALSRRRLRFGSSLVLAGCAWFTAITCWFLVGEFRGPPHTVFAQANIPFGLFLLTLCLAIDALAVVLFRRAFAQPSDASS